MKPCPKEGNGVNDYVNDRVIFLLSRGYTEDEIWKMLRDETKDCGRDTTQDIKHSIETGKDYLERDSSQKKNPQPPAPDPEYQEKIRNEFITNNVAWWKERDAGSANSANTALTKLFGNHLICVGKEITSAEGIKCFKGLKLDGYQFIVPTPALNRSGLTKEGKSSARALDNIAARWYLVVEFDGNETLDEQASVHAHLNGREDIALVMLVYSGNKSLHGWYDVYGKDESNVRSFFDEACRLGADPKTWTRNQFVRLPGGTNTTKNRKQDLIYFNGTWDGGKRTAKRVNEEKEPKATRSETAGTQGTPQQQKHRSKEIAT
jgi:hypothetical protein